MFMLIASLPALIITVALGGRFSRLAEIRLRHLWTVWAALGLQLVLFTPLGHGFSEDQLRAGQLISYVPIVAFLFLNRRLGLGLLATGVLLNFIAIVANRGVMPADPKAQEVIFGAKALAGQNLNTDSSAEHLVFLGDTMAVPAWLPHANAFSVGDLLIALGLVWLLARLTLPEVPVSGDGPIGRFRARLSQIRAGLALRTQTNSRTLVVAALLAAAVGTGVVAAGRAYSGRLIDGSTLAVPAVTLVGICAGLTMAATVTSRYELRGTGAVLFLGGLGVAMSSVAPVPMTVIGAMATAGVAFGATAWWSRATLAATRGALGVGLGIGVAAACVFPVAGALVAAASVLGLLGIALAAAGLRPRRLVLDGAAA